MSDRIVRKPCYGLDEVCRRWGLSEFDLAVFVVAGELTLSAVVAGLAVDHGAAKGAGGHGPAQVPAGRLCLTGTADLHAGDAWLALTNGSQPVRSLKTEPGRYMEVVGSDGAAGSHLTLRSLLVVRHPELERFEEAQGLRGGRGPAAPRAALNAAPAPRGAVPKYDWDAFWREVARSLLFEGVPESQASLVRRLEAWFDSRGELPDSSTLKKKLGPLWREVATEADRRRRA